MQGSPPDGALTAQQLTASIARVVARSPDIARSVRVTAEPLPPTETHFGPLQGAWTLERDPTFRCRFVARRRAEDDDPRELLNRLRWTVQRALDEGRLDPRCEAGYVACGTINGLGDPRFDECEFVVSIELG